MFDMIKSYGKTDRELLAEEISQCRQIVKTIMDFGVSQRQILHVMYSLSLELENRQALLALSESCRAFLGSDILSQEDGDVNA